MKSPDKIRAIIIDDESQCRSALLKQLEWSCPHVEVVEMAENGIIGKQVIEKHQPDLVFLDIEMPESGGFDLLKTFDEINFEVIFTTAYDAYAIDAFKVNAIDYLLKPIDEDALVEAVDKMQIFFRNRNIQAYIASVVQGLSDKNVTRKIQFPTAEGVVFINDTDIIRCESDGSYSHVYYADGKTIILAKTLKAIEALIQSDSFVRVHHSHLINVRQIERYLHAEGGQIIMSDGSTVPVSRRKKTVWKEIFT